MTAAKIENVAAPIASSKVVSLHQFGHEEQVKNTDQGNVAVSTTRKRKHPLPASDQVNVPVLQTDIEKKIALFAQNFNALSAEAKKALAEKLQAASSTLLEHLSKLAATAKNGLGGPEFNAWNQSILMAYTAFAKDQMDQNGLIMNGWQAQQASQNATLQAAADAEQKTASLPQNGAGVNVGAVIGIALGVLAAVFLIATGVGAVVAAGGLGALITAVGLTSFAATFGATAGIGLAVGVTAGIATGLGCYFGAQSNAGDYNNNLVNGGDGGKLLGGITQKGQPDATLMNQITNLNTFWSMISQKTNNNIQSGTQTNLVQPSSNDTSLGQQASQAIQAMGECMKTRAS